MPHLVEVQEARGDDGLFVIGITEADYDDTLEFAEEHEVTYPLIADGGELLEELGVRMIWGSVVYLVNPSGEILVEGLDESLQRLNQELAGVAPDEEG